MRKVGQVKVVMMKVHSAQGQNILAVCDLDLLGRTIIWGDVELLVSKGFYGGEEVDVEVMLRTAQHCSSINAIGMISTEALIEARLVSKEAIVYLDSVPHCQVYVV